MKKTMADEQESGTSDGAKKGWETRRGDGEPTTKGKNDLRRAKVGYAGVHDLILKHDPKGVGSERGDYRVYKTTDHGIVDVGRFVNQIDAEDAWNSEHSRIKRPNKQAENEEKIQMKKEAKKAMEKEEEKKEAMVAADEAEMPEAKQEAVDPEADPEHSDVAKDKELILSMIKKYMGKGEEECSEDEMEAMHEAYEAFRSMGEEEDEAMKCAAKAMKLAKHMAEKKAHESEKVEAEKCEDESEEEAKKEVVPMSPKADAEKYEGKKESEIKLVAQVAMLERKVKKYELADVLDKKLRESGLGRAETDKIRECIGEPKSEAQIVDTIKIFKEAFSVRGSESVAKDASFFVTTERAEGGKVEGKVDFAKF